MRLKSHLMALALLSMMANTTASAASRVASSQVSVIVREEQSLAQEGQNILLTIRLSPGVSARVWIGQDCVSPAENATIVTQSGNYMIPTVSTEGQRKLYSCSISSDGHLNSSLQLRD